MAKALDLMTGAEIKRAHDKAYAASSLNCKALVAAGFGHVRGSEMGVIDHPLAREWRTINEALRPIVAEIEARKRWHGGTQRITRKA